MLFILCPFCNPKAVGSAGAHASFAPLQVVTTFSFDTRGAKEKVRKKKTPQVLFRDLRVATGAMRPLTCTACGGATLACAVLINVHLSPDSETSHRVTVGRFGRSSRVLESASGAGESLFGKKLRKNFKYFWVLLG
jgi:hypothetical protein